MKRVSKTPHALSLVSHTQTHILTRKHTHTHSLSLSLNYPVGVLAQLDRTLQKVKECSVLRCAKH